MNKGYTLLVISLAAVAAFAQGPRAQSRSNQSGLDLSKTVTVSGAVSRVNIAYGVGYPAIEVSGTTIKVAPAWFLLENDFELAEGHQLVVTAAPSFADASLHALKMQNLSTRLDITLRSETGLPLWKRGNSRGAGVRQGTACLDTSTATTVTGVIDQLALGAGIRHPSLVLLVGGQRISIKLAPERVLAAADLELQRGDIISIVYVTCPCMGENVALSITKGDSTLVLREADGTPAWN